MFLSFDLTWAEATPDHNTASRGLYSGNYAWWVHHFMHHRSYPDWPIGPSGIGSIWTYQTLLPFSTDSNLHAPSKLKPLFLISLTNVSGLEASSYSSKVVCSQSCEFSSHFACGNAPTITIKHSPEAPSVEFHVAGYNHSRFLLSFQVFIGC